jgi:hypothetical protein
LFELSSAMPLSYSLPMITHDARRLLITGALVVLQAAPVPSASGGIASAAWLQGCWESVKGEHVVEEQWSAPRGTSMLGMGRTLAGDRLVDYELVILREEGSALAYEAHPSGQPSAVFRSPSISGARIVFENPEHDFPQRVGYEHTAGDELLAWIEGVEKGRSRRVDFHYQRAACPGK